MKPERPFSRAAQHCQDAGFVPVAGPLGPSAKGPFSRAWFPAVADLCAENETLLIIAHLTIRASRPMIGTITAPQRDIKFDEIKSETYPTLTLVDRAV